MLLRRRWLLILAMLCFDDIATAQPTYPCDGYVAPNAAANGDGSQSKPWDLAAAIRGVTTADGGVAPSPGKTICFKGGTYVGVGSTIQVSGSAGAPIIFRNAPGERVTFDAKGEAGTLLTVEASHVWIWGLEFTDSTGNPKLNGGLVLRAGSAAKVINCVMHDMGREGMAAWEASTDSEIVGNYSFFNGRNVSERGYGIYTQNRTTPENASSKLYEDNFFFWNFGGYNVHAYGESGALDNMTFRGNVSLDGIMMIGGTGQRAQNLVWESNFNHRTSAPGYTSIVYVGYSAGVGNAVIKDNFFVSGQVYWAYANQIQTMSGNWLRGQMYYHNNTPSGIPASRAQTDVPARFPDNHYAFGSNATNTASFPGTHVMVRKNRFEEGRGNIVVYNFEGRNAVEVDLSTLGLQTGQRFEIRDGQNFFGEPVVQDTYSGSTVSLPLNNTAVTLPRTLPAGSNSEITEIKHSSKEFNFFTVLPGSAPTRRIPNPPTNLRKL